MGLGETFLWTHFTSLCRETWRLTFRDLITVPSGFRSILPQEGGGRQGGEGPRLLRGALWPERKASSLVFVLHLIPPPPRG